LQKTILRRNLQSETTLCEEKQMKALLRTAKRTLLALSIGMPFMPAAVLALPSFDRVVNYFDGPDSYNTVGTFIQNCDGGSSLVGSRTPWYEETKTPCDMNTVPPL
jgi:hypothetical protein